MELFNGLTGIEIILMVLGVMLFFVLLFLMVYMVIRNKSYKNLIAFFLIPVLMIGFPCIKKISYDKWCIELDNQTQKVITHPNDEGAKKSLAELIDKNETRAFNDPSELSKIAIARLALHDTIKAQQSLNKALKLNPDHIIAKKLNLKLDKRILKLSPKKIH
jgi:hypothetical protein